MGYKHYYPEIYWQSWQFMTYFFLSPSSGSLTILVALYLTVYCFLNTLLEMWAQSSMNIRCDLTNGNQKGITMRKTYCDTQFMLLLIYLSFMLLCVFCLNWNETTILVNIQTGVHSDHSATLQQDCYSTSQFPAYADLCGYLLPGWVIYICHIEHHEASIGPFFYFTEVLLDWNSAIWHVSCFSPWCSMYAESVFCRIIQAADRDIE